MSRTYKWGVRFAEEGKPVSDDKNLVYDSELDQLKVNTKAIPPHLYFLKPLPKMKNLTVSTASPLASETLFKFKHNLPFVPSVWAYFYITDASGSAANFIGSYLTDFIRLGATLVYVEADKEYVYVKHDFYRAGFFGAPDVQTETDFGNNMAAVSIRTKILALNGAYTGQISKTNP